MIVFASLLWVTKSAGSVLTNRSIGSVASSGLLSLVHLLLKETFRSPVLREIRGSLSRSIPALSAVEGDVE